MTVKCLYAKECEGVSCFHAKWHQPISSCEGEEAHCSEVGACKCSEASTYEEDASVFKVEKMIEKKGW